MAKSQDPKRAKATPADGKPVKGGSGSMNQATTKEFEREDMGIAPKE